MAQRFKILVSTPATQVKGAKTWEFNNTTDNTLSVDCEMKRDKKKISNCTITLHDPDSKIFAALPDPAFADIPVDFYMAPPDLPTANPFPVFSGKITEIEHGYPGPERLIITAHDRSVDLRKKKLHRMFKGQPSHQIAKKILSEYGYELDLDLGNITPLVRNEYGPEVSDWDLLCRMFTYDGLELYMQGNKLKVRQQARSAYRLTFQRGEPPVVSLNVKISHVGKDGGDKKGNTPFDSKNSGNFIATTNPDERKVLDKQSASHRSHKGPIGSPPSSASGSHADNLSNTAWTNQVTQLKRRKDQATLVLAGTPDITLSNYVNIMGYGAKSDGQWFIEEIRQNLLGTTYGQTTLTLLRALSSGAAKQAGTPFDTATK